MALFHGNPFKHCYTLAVLVGQWPHQKPIDYIPRRCFILLVLLIFMFVQIRTMYTSNFDTQLVLKNAEILSISVIGFVNIIILYINNDDWKQILETMCNDWRQPRSQEEMKIKEKYLNESYTINMYCIVFFIIILLTAACVMSAPLLLDIIIPLNYTRPRRQLYDLDLFIDDQKYFLVYMGFYFASSIIGMTLFVANLYLVEMAVYHACGMFDVLGYRLEHVFDSEDVNQNVQLASHRDTAVYQNVILCIKAHCETERFSKLVETWLSPIILTLLVSDALAMSFSLSQIIDVNTVSWLSIGNVMFHFSFLAVLMNMGQKMINISTETCERAYNGKWYHSNIRAQKLLLTMLECYTPHSLHGYKMMHLSLETGQAIIRAGVSFCLMFRAL